MSRPKATLRQIHENDLAQLMQWRNHPDVRRYMYTQHEIDEAEHLAWFHRVKNDPNRYPLLVEREGDPFGFVSIRIDDLEGRRASWGFYLSQDAPRGSGQAMGTSALEYAFEELRVHKLCGEALSGNQRSLQYHERLGFSREAVLRDHFFDGRVYHDVIGYGLLRSEWHTRQGD
jgi:UDP-4-amino-4,6-dideoxy-N-acetyl-beta-L-altrosamine N-acetyltransferase